MILPRLSAGTSLVVIVVSDLEADSLRVGERDEAGRPNRRRLEGML